MPSAGAAPAEPVASRLSAAIRPWVPAQVAVVLATGAIGRRRQPAFDDLHDMTDTGGSENT